MERKPILVVMAAGMGDDVLFSMNDDITLKGIQLNGWLMNVYGSMHSNSDIEANCSIITVNGAETGRLLGCFVH